MWCVHCGKSMRLDEFHDAKKSLSYVLSQGVELAFNSSIEHLDPPRQRIGDYR